MEEIIRKLSEVLLDLDRADLHFEACQTEHVIQMLRQKLEIPPTSLDFLMRPLNSTGQIAEDET